MLRQFPEMRCCGITEKRGGKKIKKIIALVSTVVVAFAVGLAFADEMPWHKTFENGAYLGRALTDAEIGMAGVKGAAPGGIREDVLERSTEVVESLFGRSISPDQPDPYLGFLKNNPAAGVKGAAPGGIREDVLEKSTAVVESLFGRSISLDQPDPYRGFYAECGGTTAPHSP